MSDIFEAKKVIEMVIENFEIMAKEANVDGMGDCVLFDLIKFMIYLISSDGEIRPEEIAVISKLTDMNFTQPLIEEFIDEYNIRSSEFEKEIPTSLDFAVKFDNALYMAAPEHDVDCPGLFINTYRAIGDLFIELDVYNDVNKQINLDFYIGMLNSYANENSQRRNY